MTATAAQIGVLTTQATQVNENSAENAGLAGRVSRVGNWLKREGKWTAASAAIGMAANILTAKVALAGAPLLVGAAAGMVAANLVTTGFRKVRENTQADKEARIKAGEEGVSTLKLFFKHAATDNIIDRDFWKKSVTGLAISSVFFGLGQIEVGDFFMGSAEAAEVHATEPMQLAMAEPVADAPSVEVSDLADPQYGRTGTEMDHVAALLDAGDLSSKQKKLLEYALAHQDKAQAIKDAAQSLVKTDKDLALELYRKAIDVAAEHGQKTAWAQAMIDDAYLRHDSDPSASIEQMRQVAEQSKGKLGKMAQKFLADWTGTHHAAPVAPVAPGVELPVTEFPSAPAIAAIEPDQLDLPQSLAMDYPAADTVGQVVPVSAEAVSAEPVSVVPVSAAAYASAGMPSTISLGDEFGKAQDALAQNYARAEMTRMATDMGIAAQPEMADTDLAETILPGRGDDLIAGLAGQAPQLDPNKYAFACVTDLSQATQDGSTVQTLCTPAKNVMDGGDFGTVRDANDPSSKGIHHLFSRVACGVTECIDRYVTHGDVPARVQGLRSMLGMR